MKDGDQFQIFLIPDDSKEEKPKTQPKPAPVAAPAKEQKKEEKKLRWIDIISRTIL